jgi:lysophospholipase L1-like esterase
MKLLILGDSNSGGLYNAMAGLTAPAGLLRPDVQLVNEARGGESSAQGRARIAEVVTRGPYSLALVCYGGVDVLTDIINGTQGAALNALNNMLAIEAALKAGGTPLVYLAEGVGCVVGADAASASWTVAQAAALRRGYFDIGHCLRMRGHLLSYATAQVPAYWLHASIHADVVHLSLLGYERLALRVAVFLRDRGVAV